MQRIKLKVLNTPDEIFRDTQDIDITLNESCLLYEFDGYCTTENKESYFLERRCISKEDISLIRLVWNEINEQFQITLFIKGVNIDSNIELFFSEFNEANNIYKKFLLWRFKI